MWSEGEGLSALPTFLILHGLFVGFELFELVRGENFLHFLVEFSGLLAHFGFAFGGTFFPEGAQFLLLGFSKRDAFEKGLPPFGFILLPW